MNNLGIILDDVRGNFAEAFNEDAASTPLRSSPSLSPSSSLSSSPSLSSLPPLVPYKKEDKLPLPGDIDEWGMNSNNDWNRWIEIKSDTSPITRDTLDEAKNELIHLRQTHDAKNKVLVDEWKEQLRLLDQEHDQQMSEKLAPDKARIRTQEEILQKIEMAIVLMEEKERGNIKIIKKKRAEDLADKMKQSAAMLLQILGDVQILMAINPEELVNPWVRNCQMPFCENQCFVAAQWPAAISSSPLHCGHCMCWYCLIRLVEKSGGSFVVKCPLCRVNTRVTEYTQEPLPPTAGKWTSTPDGPSEEEFF